jgi:hypothetical protein
MIQRVGFREVTDLLFCFEGLVFYIDATYRGGAAIGLQVTGNDLHGSGFAGSVRAQEADYFAFTYFEGYGVYRFLLAIELGKLGYFN